MGSCLSKKNAKQSGPSAEEGEKTGVCRDPPPTESPQEEKVKEVLFLTQTPKLTPNLNNNGAELVLVRGGEVKMEDEGRLKTTKNVRNQAHDLERSEDSTTASGVDCTVSERSFSAASTAFTRPEEEEEIEDDDEEVVMEMNMMTKKKQQQQQQQLQQRSVARSTSPAAKAQKKMSCRPLEPRSAGQQQTSKRVDVGCRSARLSSPSSPARNRAPSNNGSKRDLGERRRSGSPADAMMMKKKRAAAAAEPAAQPMDQHQHQHQHQRQCMKVNERFSPSIQQRIPRVAEEEEDGVRKGQDEGGVYNRTGRRLVMAGDTVRSDGSNHNNNNVGNEGSGGGGGCSEAKESLENPLVSLECFIFL